MATTSKPTNAKTKTEQFLTFLLPPEQKVILPTKQLVEILSLSLGQITPITDLAPAVMGVCNWRGEVLWVVDLGYLLGFNPLFHYVHTQSTYKVILVHSQGYTLGLAVSQVGQMLWCDPTQIQPASATFVDSELAAYLRGYWLDPNGDAFLVLDADALCKGFT